MIKKKICISLAAIFILMLGAYIFLMKFTAIMNIDLNFVRCICSTNNYTYMIIEYGRKPNAIMILNKNNNIVGFIDYFNSESYCNPWTSLNYSKNDRIWFNDGPIIIEARSRSVLLDGLELLPAGKDIYDVIKNNYRSLVEDGTTLGCQEIYAWYIDDKKQIWVLENNLVSKYNGKSWEKYLVKFKKDIEEDYQRKILFWENEIIVQGDKAFYKKNEEIFTSFIELKDDKYSIMDSILKNDKIYYLMAKQYIENIGDNFIQDYGECYFYQYDLKELNEKLLLSEDGLRFIAVYGKQFILAGKNKILHSDDLTIWHKEKINCTDMHAISQDDKYIYIATDNGGYKYNAINKNIECIYHFNEFQMLLMKLKNLSMRDILLHIKN